MKHKRINNILIISILLMVFSACEDWFELEPENDLIQQEFWQKKQDVDAVVAAMYDAFRETSLENLIWGEVRADMYRFLGSDFSDYDRIAKVDISSTNDAVDWKKYYEAINMANTVMLYSGDVQAVDKTFSEEEKLIYDSEALFIRSLCYFYLVRLWKDVPLVLQSSNSDTVDFFQPKRSENEVLNHIVEDLKYAETIARDPGYNAEEDPFLKGRVNKYAIQALLADILLWQEKYQDCIAYCDKIIGTGLYKLEPEQSWFELYYPGNSVESIFEIQYNDNFQHEHNPVYNEMIPTGGSIKTVITPEARNLFPLEDVRNCRRQYAVWKYLGKNLEGITRDATERDANYIYYRYADILLMKAEALAEQQKFSEASILFNQVVERSGLPPVIVAPNIEAYRSFILEERAREFALEGKRWFDVLRFAKRDNFNNKEIIMEMILAGASAKDRPILKAKLLDTLSYYLPVPEKDLNYNPNLVQNPYYDR